MKYNTFLLILLLVIAKNGFVQDINNVIIGIDHIPIAVKNLDSAASFFHQLGFALKPGRFHANGIQNKHVKFRNGTELELITASQSLDTLSTEYCNALKEGEGPVFVGLYAPNAAEIAKHLTGYCKYIYNPGVITFPPSGPFHFLFFGSRNISPTDKPEHFAHSNSATTLTAVWLATDNSSQLLELFQKLDITTEQKRIHTPVATITAPIAKLKEGEVILLPASNQIIKNHPIIGATVKVDNMEALKGSLKKAGLKIPAVIKGENNTLSLFLPPAITHSIWLEFRQY